MMKHMILLPALLASTLLLAQADRNKPNPSKTEAVILKSSSLTIKRGEESDSNNYYPQMNAGKMWVFQYSYTASEYPEITDDEYTESFSFQLAPPKGNSFRISGKGIAAANSIFQKSCFCADRGYFRIKEGTITGTKLNNSTWVVNVEITVPPKGDLSIGSIKKKFTTRYRIQVPSK